MAISILCEALKILVGFGGVAKEEVTISAFETCVVVGGLECNRGVVVLKGLVVLLHIEMHVCSRNVGPYLVGRLCHHLLGDS